MKKHISNIRSFCIRILSPLFFFSSMVAVLFSTPVMAQDFPGQPRVIVRNALPIDGAPVFQVFIEKEKIASYDLFISDTEGNILYAERIRNAQYAKRFKIDMPGSENVKLVMKLMDKSRKDVQTFYIDTKTTVQQDLVVSRD
jgi:hypothetical protein